MRNNWRVLIPILFFGFVLYVIYSSLGLDQVSCEVCVRYKGREACAGASGTSQEEAVRTATEVACSKIASGRNELIVCNQTPPQSIRCQPR